MSKYLTSRDGVDYSGVPSNVPNKQDSLGIVNNAGALGWTLDGVDIVFGAASTKGFGKHTVGKEGNLNSRLDLTPRITIRPMRTLHHDTKDKTIKALVFGEEGLDLEQSD